MHQNWRTKIVEEDDSPSGSNPEYGAIFMSSRGTKKECLRRGVFGLPSSQASFVMQVKAGMLLFLFEYESRRLHGVFQAASNGAMNIVPSAFSSSRKLFPAQVKFVEMWPCRPLHESEFRGAIRENYFSAKKFNLGLSEVQVRRLLRLFSLERSLLVRTEVAKPTESPSNVFKRGVVNHSNADGASLEHYGDSNHKFDLKVMPPPGSSASRRNPVECCRLAAFSSLNNEIELDRACDMAARNDYSKDTSDDFRRVFDQSMSGIRDGIGDDLSRVSSFRNDASTMPFDYSLSNIRRISENLRHTPSERFESKRPDSDGFAQVVPTRDPTSWSTLSPSANDSKGPVEADTLVFDPPSPLEPLYTMNTWNYNPSYSSLRGDATIASTMPHGSGLSNVDSMLSSASAANPSSVSREGLVSYISYFDDTLSSEKVQPSSSLREHDAASSHMDVVQGDYIPLPSNLHEYQTGSTMIGVTYENVSTKLFQDEVSRDCACHSPFPDLLTSREAGKRSRNYKSLSHSSSPSMLHPSLVYPLSSWDGVDHSFQDRHENEVPAYERKTRFGGDASSFNNEWGWFQDHVSHDDCESQQKSNSFFTRLVLPPEECCTKRDTSNAADPVDEVMAFLHDCRENWMKQKACRRSRNYSGAVSEFKTKKQKSHAKELTEDNPMSPTETSVNVVLACDESVRQTAKPNFIDFRRRSETQKMRHNLTQGCNDSPEDPTPQKRKLVRPKLSKEEPSKEKGTSHNFVENEADSVISIGENKVVKKTTLVRPKLSKEDPSKANGTSDNFEENGTDSVISIGENKVVKKRKLVRTKLSKEEPSKEKGTSDNFVQNGTASVISVGEDKAVTCEVLVTSSADMKSRSCPSQGRNTNGYNGQMLKHNAPLKKKGASDNLFQNDTSSCSITFVGENKVGTCEVSVMSSMDMESNRCPSRDGKSSGHNEEMRKHEEAKEDALIL